MEEGSLEARINRATNPLNKEQNWEDVEAFCHQLNSDLEGPQLATRLLAHKIQSPQEWEAMQALTVLEACMKNCGKRFHGEVGKFRFLNELIKVVSPKYLGTRSPERVKQKILELLYSWTLGLPNEVKIAEAYQMLKKQGILKEDPKLPAEAMMPPPPPRPKNAIFDDDEKSKMLARLLKSTHPEDLRAANKLIKEMVQEDQKRMEKISKRVNAIEEVNNNVRLLGEMLNTFRAGQSSEGSEDLMKELYQKCEKMRPTLFRLASDTEDNDEALAEILQANDSLTQVINTYRQLVKGEEINGETSSNNMPASSSALLDLSGLDMTSTAAPSYPSVPAQPLPYSSSAASSASTSLSLLDDELMSLGINESAPPAQPSDTSSWNSFQSSVVSTEPSGDKGSSLQTPASKALDDLDLLGKTLLQQSLPPSAVHVPWEKNQHKPTLRDLQCKTSSTLPQPVAGLGNVSSEEEQTAPSPVKNDISLTNVTVPLESIKPSSILPVTVYDQRSFRVLFHFAQDSPPGRPDVLVVVISMLSTAPLPVTGISFQAAVPKAMKVKLQPATGSELPAFNPILPPTAITQVLLLANPTQADQQVEVVKRAAHLVGKRLASCMQGPLSSDMDKRLKKLTLMSLSMAMADCLKDMESESSLRRTLEMGCCAEGSLAQSLAEFEMNVERDILQHLNKLSEEDLPAILKRRKQLQKLLTDWNSAKTRLSQVQKNMAAAPVGSSAGTPAKLESLKEEAEELRRRVEQSKDDYLSDLYHFGTKEDEYKNYFIRLLELQAEYHRKSLTQLTDVLGELRDTIKDTAPAQPPPAEVYGVPLATHLHRFGCEIAVPISACVRMLLSHGMKEEGLFRLAAGASILKKLKASLGAGVRDLEEFVSEPHAVAGALKSYLRELPEPLMTSELFDEWIKAASIKEADKRQESYREVCDKLPPENYNNLRYLIKFLAKLAEHQEVNKMTPSNIAIVLGPNLLWARSEGDPSLLDMASASPILVVSVVEGLISCSSEVFPEDVNFGVPEETADPPTAEITPATPETPWKSQSPNLPTSPTQPSPEKAEISGDALSDALEPSASKANAAKILPPPEERDAPGAPGESSPGATRKVKRPAPLRPNVPPPVQPRGAATTETYDELQNPRPVPRRNIGGSLKVPNLPPPHPPAPKTATIKAEASDSDLSRKTPPRPLPRNRIQSTDS